MNVEVFVKQVNRDHYVLQENGYPLTQSTATDAIVQSLCLLDVQPGERVLEIGTGSGYSTALLAHLVGEEGHVVSIDIDPHITQRAKQRLLEDNIKNTTLLTKDGRKGYAEQALYDRIVSWATSDDLPRQWIDQLKNKGVIVAPFMLVPLAYGIAIARLRKEGQEVVGECLRQGAYICLNDTPEYESLGPELRADVVHRKGEQVVSWASAQWMKTTHSSIKQQWLWELSKSETEQQLMKGGENYDAFRAFLLAKQPVGLTTAYTDNKGLLIGISSPSSFALLSEESLLYQMGSLTIQYHLEEWRALGCAGMEQLKPVVKLVGSTRLVQATLDEEDEK